MSTAQAAGAETTRQTTAPPRQKTTDRARAERKLAKSSAAPPGMSTNAEDQARQGFESGRSYY